MNPAFATLRARPLASTLRVWVLLLALPTGCSWARPASPEVPHATLSAEVALAEGDTGKPALTREPTVESPAARATSSVATGQAVSKPIAATSASHDLPDPKPLATRDQWRYQLRYRHGAVTITAVTRERFKTEVVTARMMGRFAFELWLGRELIERRRFDFPLLAAEPAVLDGSLREPPSLLAGADTQQSFLVPHSERATSARIVDRATGKKVAVPWPPEPIVIGTEEAAGPD